MMADAAAKTKATASILAQVLLTEVQFPVVMQEQHKRKALQTWYDTPPTRKELRFQTQDVGNPELMDTAKAATAVSIADHDKPEDMEELFCPVHGDFVLISGTDIEHGMPFTQIRDRQQQLLGFLNDPANKVLADELLKQPGMSDFFRRDGKSDKVQMSRYFALMCYNNISNLWLICHACNIHKVDKDSMAWFAEQKYFGDDFVAVVGTQGGLHRGLIFDQVGGAKKETVTISGKPVEIYQGGTGIGQYAIDWFKENKKELMDAFRRFHTGPEHTFRALMDKMNEALKSKDLKAVRTARREAEFKTGAANAVLKEPLDLHSGSESDTSSQDEAQQSRVAASAQEGKRNTSFLKEINKLLKAHYKKAGVDEGEIDALLSIHTKTLIEKTSPEYMEKLVKDIKERIGQAEAAGISIPLDYMKKHINQSIEAEIHRAEIAEQRAETEKQQKEAERQQRLAAEQQRVAAEQQISAQEQELIALRAQIAANKSQQTAAPSSILPMGTTSLLAPSSPTMVFDYDPLATASLASRAKSDEIKKRSKPDVTAGDPDGPPKPPPPQPQLKKK